MKHLVWGIIVLAYLASIVLFPTQMTLVALFLGAYKISEIGEFIGKWVETKYKANRS